MCSWDWSLGTRFQVAGGSTQSPAPSPEEADIPHFLLPPPPVTSVWTKVLDDSVTCPAVNPRLHLRTLFD